MEAAIQGLNNRTPMRKSFILFAMILFSVLSGCEEKGPARKLDDKVDDALDRRPNERARDAAEEVKEAVKEAGREIKRD